VSPILSEVCLSLAIVGLLGLLMLDEAHRVAEKVRKRDEQRRREHEWMRSHGLDNHDDADDEDPTFDTGQYPPREDNSPTR
jgi:hypothetical protein